MQRTKRLKRCIGPLILSCVAFGCVRTLYKRLGTPTHYSFSFDRTLSRTLRANIVDFISNTDHSRRLSLAGLSVALRERFACIKTIELALHAPGTLSIVMQSHTPCARINDEFVMTDEGTIFAAAAFHEACVARLDHVVMPSCSYTTTAVSPSVCQSIKDLPSSLYENYNVQCLDDTAVCLEDKACPGFSIMCNAQSLPDEQLLYSCDQIKKDVAQGTARSRCMCWQADVRFADQIIVSSHKRGASYGERIS